MVLSRGLVISIGVSALSCTLLFLYFRNKISSVEKKVDLMFELIQNYDNNESSFIHNTSSESRNDNNLIEVSDNEFSDDDDDENDEHNMLNNNEEEEYDDDSEEVSDDEEDIKKLSLDVTEEINLGDTTEIKSIDLIENENKDQTISTIDEIELGEPLDTDSLDDIDDEQDDDDDDDDDDNTVGVVKADNNEETEEIINYKKLRVPELKALAKEKGLTNYTNLKKQPLIDLLLSSE